MRFRSAFPIAVSTICLLATARPGRLAGVELPPPLAISHVQDGNTALAPGSFREILSASEISAESLAAIPAAAPTADTRLSPIDKILFRTARLDPQVVANWVTASTPRQLVQTESSLRGEFIELQGRVVVVEALRSDEERVTDDPPLVRCVMELREEGLRAVIWTRRVPTAWLAGERHNEQASVRGVFTGVHAVAEDRKAVVVVAPRVAWFPDALGHVATTPGRKLLGEMGVDVGLLEDVRHGLHLSRDDREPFYSLLAAVRRADAGRLDRVARASLADYAAPWREEQPAGERRPLAKMVLDAASQGRYSVAPLFKDAENQTGQLVRLEGLVRRAIRIEVEDAPSKSPGSGGPVGEPLNHYFELELFTPDSQNLPLVCCVPTLPNGFPLGDEIRERVRLNGFFFKRWRYDSRSVLEAPTGPLRFEPTAAPLLIAAQPHWPLPQETGRNMLAWITGGLFVAVTGLLCLIVWRWSLSDRQFRRRRDRSQRHSQSIGLAPDNRG